MVNGTCVKLSVVAVVGRLLLISFLLILSDCAGHLPVPCDEGDLILEPP